MTRRAMTADEADDLRHEYGSDCTAMTPWLRNREEQEENERDEDAEDGQ